MKWELIRSIEMRFMKRITVCCIAAFVILSCKGKIEFIKKKALDEKILVQYGEHFLTDRDINLILPKDVSKEDSVKLVKTYIEEWVKKKAIVDKAEENIDELTLKEIDNKMVEYRQDLLINAYNNYLIDKNIQDSISESEIEAYFEKNNESFPLSKDIVRYRSVTVAKENEQEATRLFNSGKDEDFDKLMRMILANGLPYHDRDSVWYTVDVLSSRIPQLAENDNAQQLLNRRRLKITTDSTVTMIRILNLKQKGTQAPYDFVKPTIKNLLLNKRKLNLLSDLQNQLYKDAINNNEIKINEN